MRKFLMMLGLVVLVISCGQQELPKEEGSPQKVGSRFELKDIQEFNKSEKDSLKEACTALALKENIFENNYAGKGVFFDFTSVKQSCGPISTIKYQTAAKVEYQNGKMVFEKLSSGAVIFNDIVLRHFGPLKLFCDKLEANALAKRFISSGNTINIVYAVGKGDKLLVAVEKGFLYNSDGKYTSISNDKFLINNANNKYKGFVLKRSLESSAGCTGADVSKLVTELNKVH